MATRTLILVDGSAVRRIRERKLAKTQKELGDLAQLSDVVIRKIEAGGRRVNTTTFWKLTKALGLTEQNAMTELAGNPGEGVLSPSQKFKVVSTRKYPYFDVKIPAGHWTETGDGRSIEEADGWVELPLQTPDDAFCLKIEGHCMEPEYPSGSILVFVPIRPGENNGRQFENGRDYYFEHVDQKATFKRVFWDAEAEEYRLECLNPKYKGIRVPGQMMARMSRAVKLIRDLK